MVWGRNERTCIEKQADGRATGALLSHNYLVIVKCQ